MRKPLRYILVLGAFAALVVGLSACAAYKAESFSIGQPGGVGSVRVHFVLCSSETGEDNGIGDCEGAEETETSQTILSLTVPKGWSGPASFEVPSSTHGPTLRFTRNQEVSEYFLFQPEGESGPSSTYENVGYLSAPFEEIEGERNEWDVNVDFTPPEAGGVPYAGTFEDEIGVGWREIDDAEGLTANRPIDCFEGWPEALEPPSEPITSACEFDVADGETTVTDARVGPAPAVSAPVGGKATLTFPLAAASTASPAPGFSLTAATSIPGGSATPVEPTYSPAYDATTHRAAPASRAVAVTMPPTTPPGTYTVTLAAHAAAGGTVTNTGQIVVGQLSLGLGKAKRNLKKGTATVSVSVPAAGTLAVTGKGIAKATKSAPGPGQLKVTIRTKGKAKKQLLAKGKTRVKPNFVFTPANGAPIARPKPLILRLNR